MSLAGIKKGSEVAMVGFTGMRIGTTFKVEELTKTEVVVATANGRLTFDRKTGVQTGLPEEKAKYANKIMLPAEAPEKSSKKKAQPKKEAKPAKAAPKSPAEPIEEDDDDDYAEVE